MKLRDIKCEECGNIATIFWRTMRIGYCLPCETDVVARLIKKSMWSNDPFPEDLWIMQRDFINQDVELGRRVAANPENFA